MRGNERALIDFGLVPRPEWKIWIDPTTSRRGTRDGRRYLGGYAAALPVLKSLSDADKPLAIFAHNDYSAWGVFEACRELGLAIPEDVSLICCDDSDIIRAMTPPLTAVSQRTVEIGRVAVAILERRLQAGSADLDPQHVLIDVDIVERHSVRSVPTG